MKRIKGVGGDLGDFVEPLGLKFYVKEELGLCPRCEGTGEVRCEELEDYHHRTCNVWFVPCDECNSTGRIYKQTLNLTGFRPFKEAGDGN